MMTGTPDTVTLVPINRIEILNSRDRNMKVFEEIVDNIRAIGLKKPITVAERPGDDGDPRYVLVCGEGRLNAFRILGETHTVIALEPGCVLLEVKAGPFDPNQPKDLAAWAPDECGPNAKQYLEKLISRIIG